MICNADKSNKRTLTVQFYGRAVANGNDFTHKTIRHVTVKVRFLQECVVILVSYQ